MSLLTTSSQTVGPYVKIGFESFAVVDLAPLVVPGMPGWPSHPPVEIVRDARTFARDGYFLQTLVLPEQLLIQRGEGAWLTTNLAADGESGPANAEAAMQEPELGLRPEEWRELVGETALKIGSGELGVRKLVLARATQVAPRRSIQAALRTLVAEYPRCTIFALAEGDACFLGATPERLISLHGGIASTMALAGSGLRGGSPDEDEHLAERLRNDPKEVGEHAIVVDAIREALADVCERVVVDAEPRVEKLSNVQHLLSVIRGQLREGRNVLELVQRLHPTPAVGGYPRQRALELIRQLERLDRGWYAAPIGWMGANGDGEFVVGLRSALVSNDTATLFAGCGIVAESDPHTEYAEWGWKLRPMLSALGAQP